MPCLDKALDSRSRLVVDEFENVVRDVYSRAHKRLLPPGAVVIPCLSDELCNSD